MLREAEAACFELSVSFEFSLGSLRFPNHESVARLCPFEVIAASMSLSTCALTRADCECKLFELSAQTSCRIFVFDYEQHVQLVGGLYHKGRHVLCKYCNCFNCFHLVHVMYLSDK